MITEADRRRASRTKDAPKVEAAYVALEPGERTDEDLEERNRKAEVLSRQTAAIGEALAVRLTREQIREVYDDLDARWCDSDHLIGPGAPAAAGEILFALTDALAVGDRVKSAPKVGALEALRAKLAFCARSEASDVMVSADVIDMAVAELEDIPALTAEVETLRTAVGEAEQRGYARAVAALRDASKIAEWMVWDDESGPLDGENAVRYLEVVAAAAGETE